MPSRKCSGTLMLVVVLLLQMLLVAPAATGNVDSDDEHRLPNNYLTVFFDDFETGVLDPKKWVFMEGPWSTDNIERTPSGGLFTGDDIYLTESPYPNEFGNPLDDNGNEGIYFPEEVAMIETTWIDLANLSSPRLEFDHLYDIPSPGDGATVYVMTDSRNEWELVQPDTPYPEVTGWSGISQTWVRIIVRLEEYEDERIRVGFFFKSTPDGVEGDGWQIDDIEVGGKPEGMLSDLKFTNTRIYLGGYTVSSAVAGDVLEFNMTVINDGRAHTGPFVVSVYTDHPLVGGEEIGREVILDGLAVGVSTWLTMDWVASPGRYSILLMIDELNRVPEENELNNRRRLSLDIDDPAAGDIVLKGMRFESDGNTILGAAVGDLVTIVATLANVGSSTVTTPMVVRAYDEPPVPGSVPIGDEQPSFNGLEQEGERPIEIHWRPLEGNHTVYLVVSPQNPTMILDFNPANNITSAELMVTDNPTVDLVVEELHFIVDGLVTTVAAEGQNVHILAMIGNEGETTFEGTIEVAIYRGDPDANGVEFGLELAIVTIEPAGTIEVEFDWRGVLGTHAMTVFVDPRNQIYESVEDNNQLDSGLTIGRKPLADLSISSLKMLLNDVELDPTVGTNEGASVEFRVTVKNTGNEETKGETVTALYLGNPYMEMALQSLGTFTVPEGLNPDEVYIGSIHWDAERHSQRTKVPVLYVIVDDGDTEPEVDEFNNFDLRKLPVDESRPDLTVSTLELLDDEGVPLDMVTYGTTVTVTVRIRNIGTAVNFQVANVDFFLDDSDQSNLIKSLATTPLDINETWKKSFTWVPVPDDVSGGPHTIIAHVDAFNEIVESSDANNILTADIEIDAGPNAKPNLIVQGITVYKVESESDLRKVTSGEVLPEDVFKVVDRLDEGDKGYIVFRVYNFGNAPLYTRTKVDMYHGDPAKGGKLVASWQLPPADVQSLPTGEFFRFEEVLRFDRDDPVFVRIDDGNTVKETNENDNLGTHYVTVVPPPEGANYILIGAMLGIGILVFLALTVLIRRRPEEVLEPEEPEEPLEDETEPEAEVVAPEEAEAPEDAVPEPPEGTVATAEAEAEEATQIAPEPEAEPEEEAPPVEEAEPTVPPKPPEGPVAEAEVELDEVAEGEPLEAEAPPAAPTCPSCGEEVDPEWILCPFCDHSLK
jgi:subtilase family serine protease